MDGEIGVIEEPKRLEMLDDFPAYALVRPVKDGHHDGAGIRRRRRLLIVALRRLARYPTNWFVRPLGMKARRKKEQNC
jgi:hypothetical protein